MELNFKAYELAISKRRKMFQKESDSIGCHFKESVNLFFYLTACCYSKFRSKGSQYEKLNVSVLGVNSVLAAYCLLESGHLPVEGIPLIRKAIEYQMIAIDVSCNPESIEEWKKSEEKDLSFGQNFYFSRKNIMARAKEMDIYPDDDLEQLKHLNGEWEKASNFGAHAFTKRQNESYFSFDNAILALIVGLDEKGLKICFDILTSLVVNFIEALLKDSGVIVLVNKDDGFRERYTVLKIEICRSFGELEITLRNSPRPFNDINVESLRGEDIKSIRVVKDPKKGYGLTIDHA